MSGESDSRLGAHYTLSNEYDVLWADTGRIQIPPPEIESVHGAAQIRVLYPDREYRLSEQFGSPEFLRYLRPSGGLTIPHSAMDWQYEDRRKCQKVLPFIHVGPYSALRAAAWDQPGPFTLIVLVRTVAQARFMDVSKVARQYSAQHMNIDLATPEDLIHKFPLAIRAVNMHLEMSCNLVPEVTCNGREAGGRVLVICDTGHIRSAAFVAAYLMAVYGVDMVKAVQIVQSQRFSVSLDDDTKSALKTFEMLLDANHDVEIAERQKRLASLQHREQNSPPQISGNASRKRLLEELDGETVVDQSVYGGRQGQAPFEDV